MKKLICLTFFLMLSSSISFAQVKVVTTTTDLASLALLVGGDLVMVNSLATGQQDPHFLEAKPSYAVLMNKADLFIHIGLGLEDGWLPALLAQARNPEIQETKLGNLNASLGLTVLGVPEGPIDRSEGDLHPDGNPHYWLNPNNGIKIAEKISIRLIQLDPENAKTYHENFLDFKNRFSKKIQEFKESFPKEVQAVTYHQAWPYFADWLGIKIIDQIEPKPGIPPSPRHLLQLREKMIHVSIIFVGTYYNTKAAEKLSNETKIPYVILPLSVGNVKQAKTYEDLFDYLTQSIRERLKV